MAVKSVDRIIKLLELFSRRRPWLGITEIAQSLDVSKAAAHGLVRTLTNGRLLQQDPKTRKYSLGLKTFEIGMIQPDITEINQKATNAYRALSRSTRMTSHVALWDGAVALLAMTASFPNARPVVFGIIGPGLDAYASGLGKAMLARLTEEKLDEYLQVTELKPHTSKTITDPAALREDLAETRERGYSIEREELVLGAASVAAPILDREAGLIGAISLFSTPERLLNPEKIQDLALQVRQAADEISSLFGCSPDHMNYPVHID